MAYFIIHGVTICMVSVSPITNVKHVFYMAAPVSLPIIYKTELLLSFANVI